MTVRELIEALSEGVMVRWEIPPRVAARGGLPGGAVAVMPCCSGGGGAPDLEAGGDGLYNKLIVSKTRGTPELYKVEQVLREKYPSTMLLKVRPAGGTKVYAPSVWIRRDEVVGVLIPQRGESSE